jgi:voltage-gated potassium channel Kch
MPSAVRAVRATPKRVSDWLSNERSLTVLLFSILVGVFVVRPLEAAGYPMRIGSSLVFTTILISGMATVAHSRAAIVLFFVGAVSVAVHWARYTVFGAEWVTADAVATLVSCATLGSLVLAEVLGEGPITSRRIQGAIAAYLLVALTFAAAFTLIDLNASDAFAGSALPAGMSRDPLQRFAYFSFITLTTVGYGDVVPQAPLARSLAILEALIGQLFPSILLARLVSMELYYRQRNFEREQAALDREALAREVARQLRDSGISP